MPLQHFGGLAFETMPFLKGCFPGLALLPIPLALNGCFKPKGGVVGSGELESALLNHVLTFACLIPGLTLP